MKTTVKWRDESENIVYHPCESSTVFSHRESEIDVETLEHLSDSPGRRSFFISSIFHHLHDWKCFDSVKKLFFFLVVVACRTVFGSEKKSMTTHERSNFQGGTSSPLSVVRSLDMPMPTTTIIWWRLRKLKSLFSLCPESTLSLTTFMLCLLDVWYILFQFLSELFSPPVDGALGRSIVRQVDHPLCCWAAVWLMRLNNNEIGDFFAIKVFIFFLARKPANSQIHSRMYEEKKSYLQCLHNALLSRVLEPIWWGWAEVPRVHYVNHHERKKSIFTLTMHAYGLCWTYTQIARRNLTDDFSFECRARTR